MLTAIRPVSTKASWHRVVFSMQTRIRGGSSETELKAETVSPNNFHGMNVATGAGSNGGHVNALGNTTDKTTVNRGNANANSAGRVWNRFTDSTTTNRSFYAISEPLTVTATASDYSTWAAFYPTADLSDPTVTIDGSSC